MRMPGRRAILLTLTLILLGVGGFFLSSITGGPSTGGTGPKPQAAAPSSMPIPSYRHVFLVVMENLPYKEALAQPTIAALARNYGQATQYFALAHPSLPNYLALASGSTWGITSDCWFCYVKGASLASQLQGAHLSWGAYMEGLPSPCWMGPYWPFTGYAGKHDPFRYFGNVRGSPSLCKGIRPLSTLDSLLSGPAEGVPRFSWITPNLCHDGHNCRPQVAAAWLASFVQKVTRSPAWKSGGILFITWDEGAGADTRGLGRNGKVGPGVGGGHVLTLVIAPHIAKGTRVATPYSHYSLLATIERILGLPYLGLAGTVQGPPMTGFWQARGPALAHR